MSAELLASRPPESESTLVLTLSNPGARNALHPDMYAAGLEALNTAERDPSIRAVVLTGADRFFCAGGNLNRLLDNRAKAPSVQAASIDLLGEWITAINTVTKPVIAAVEGAAAGAGFSLALACDLLVAADDAKFVMSYARVALTPDGGGSWFLARALPRALAAEILFEGKPAAATRLHQLGVVNRLAKPGTTRDEAIAWADQLGTMSPNALARIKSLIADAQTQPLAAHLAAERDHFVASLHHADALEGITAFLDKRTPIYKR
ncbi:oxepin-CoA hydrolase, alternative type [Burkholderia pseudomallei]|uniref:oxepin-CoA hydrolase, alternative type n=1 Tax=Burkholderia pseudomallei TaxID=28450 RepID=UPI000536908B|nr:enoyl-CoA hydratase [Burkholderia pseudomallei]KGV23852.1 enoyl-CoA hydratase/isomerase family protein [Burkholderia pseudomallei MSHR4462]KGX02604.1 enoyl-CoA hydratase/isomerase family protein [Burkholderia pseudomallei MSHR640]OMW50296.1 enoyl-CoA hydratase [Burkholderia pseudomallei]ONC51076.1 enoyl-CoA hydratase [Burkholderia pseudomallei]ONC71456.1 enoyl-CoA hydratase [Burkholderia pseudomallei]